MPSVEPLVAGLTTTGSPRSSSTERTIWFGDSSRKLRAEIAAQAGVASPARSMSTLATTLSHARWHDAGGDPT